MFQNAEEKEAQISLIARDIEDCLRRINECNFQIEASKQRVLVLNQHIQDLSWEFDSLTIENQSNVDWFNVLEDKFRRFDLQIREDLE